MAISATYVNVSQFTVSGDHEDDLPNGRVLQCIQGVDGTALVAVTAALYNGGSGLTTVTVAPPDLTSNLATVRLSIGGWGGDPDGGNLGPHEHGPAVGDGGEIASASMTTAEVTNAQRLQTPVAADDLKLIRYEHATQTLEYFDSVGTANQIFGMDSGAADYEMKSIAGTANQIVVTHAAGSITFSAPQDIAPASSPIFAGLSLTGLTGILKSAGAGGVSAVTIGSALQFFRVDSGGTGYEYVTLTSGHLDDFNISSPAAGDFLYFDGSDWVKGDSSSANDGDLLTWDDGNSKPIWSAPASGGGVSLGQVLAIAMMGMATSS